MKALSLPVRPFVAVLLLAAAAAPLAAPALAHPGHDGATRAPVARAPVPALPRPAAAVPAPLSLAQKRVYIANDDHSDYMWSTDAAGYRAAFLQMLDYYMTQAETTATRPPEQRGRFNTDGSLWLWEFERNRPPAEVQRLMQHIRAGNITVPLNTCVQLYGAMPTEAVLRSFYYAGRIERREGLRFPLVVPMENQTLPGGVASLWAGSGARYSWKGICGCATEIEADQRPREIYRFTGHDGQSILMKWNSMLDGNANVGGYAEARDPFEAVDYLTTNPGFLGRWPWDISAAFGYGWDDVASTTNQFLNAAATLGNASRKVIVSNEIDFFEDFEQTYGSQILPYSAGYGNEWELLTATLGEVTARMKRNVEKLRTAEALATVAALQDPGFMTPYLARRDSAMLAAGLYYEHSWSAGPGVTEPAREAWQRSIEGAFTGYVDALGSGALAAVAGRVRRTGAEERHLVFNPLSWRRTDVVDLDSAVPEPRHVVDLGTGATLPSQTVAGPGPARLRVRVGGVPSVGYRVLEVRAGAGTAFPPAAATTATTLDNGIYRVTLGSRGQLASVLDWKDGGRELVGAGWALNDVGAGARFPAGPVTLESAGPVSATLRMSAGAPLTRETRVTLYAGLDRIDLDNRILENFSDEIDYRSVFDLPGMTMRHEEVGSIARVGRLANGGDYADENTRTDWLTLNHFVDLSQPGRGVTVSAWDTPFFQAGNSTASDLDGTTPKIRALVGANDIVPAGGIGGQGGDSFFLSRFALRTHGPWDAAPAMRFALEHQNPLVAARLTGDAGGTLPDSAWSLVDLPSNDVVLWALKPAEDGIGSGVVARVWNLSDDASPLILGLPPYGVAAAWRTTHVETELEPAVVGSGGVNAMLERQQLATYRLLPVGAVAAVEPPAATSALAAWPNPARGAAPLRVGFALARPGRARLTVVDVRGARVATLLDGALDAGRRVVTWDGRSERGERVAPGLYFARLESPEGVSIARLVRLD